MTSEMRRMADEVSVTDAGLEEVEFTSGDGISFSATVSFDLDGVSEDPEGGWRSNNTFRAGVTGHESGDGIEIDSVQ